MQTARSDEFIGKLKQGTHLLLIADEVHQLGSKENSNAMAIEAGKRLGLSATPERYNDPIGTLANHRLLWRHPSFQNTLWWMRSLTTT